MADDSTFNIEERSTGIDLQAELNKLKAENSCLRDNLSKATEGNEPLTSAKIRQFLNGRGYDVKEGLAKFTFKIEDQTYELDTDQLPIINYFKYYSIKKVDEEDFGVACQMVMLEDSLIKAFVCDGGEYIFFYCSSIETDSKHFEAVFDKYISAIENAATACVQYYNQVRKDKHIDKFNKGPQLGKQS